MSIIRVEHKRRYAVISSEVFKPNQLSWQAMGMLSFLLEKPDNWKVVVSYLVDVTKGAKKETGSNGVYNIINELKEKGFITCKKNSDGTTDYTVYDEPINPNQANPNQAKTTLINTDIKLLLSLNNNSAQNSDDEFLRKQHENKNDAKASDADASVSSSDKQSETEDKPKAKRRAKPKWEEEALNTLMERGVEEQLARDYLAVRKAKRANSLTETALKGLEREAASAGISLSTALMTCCERNWVGFKADWYLDGVRSGRIKPQGGLTSVQIGESDGSEYGDDVTGVW